MVISQSNTILAILVISVLPLATVPFMNSDLSDFSDPNYWIHIALIILICLSLLLILFLWIRLKKLWRENQRLMDLRLQLQEQLIHVLNSNIDLLREFNSYLIQLLHEYLHLNVENFDPLDDEHLDNEDLDQADEIEIIYETCTFLY